MPPAAPDHALGRRPVQAAILGAGFIAFSGILVRLADVSPETAAVFRCAYALPLLGALAWWERRRYGARPRRERVLGLVAGVLFAADLIFWHRSIADVGAGLATVLGNLQVVLVAFVAWAVLGERPGSRVIVAVPVALTGAVMISGLLEAGAYGDNPARGTVYGVLTTLAYSGFILVLRQTNADVRRPAGPLFDASLAAAVVATAFGAAVGTVDLTPAWPSHGWLVALAVSSQVVGWLFISISLPRLPAAMTSLLLLIQPVSAVALAALILGESPTVLQIGGVVVILAGVVYATGPHSRAARSRAAPSPSAAS